jgi:hypothetical protein
VVLLSLVQAGLIDVDIMGAPAPAARPRALLKKVERRLMAGFSVA